MYNLLIFDQDDAHFGVDATLVRETVWLPELTLAEEAPPYIVGIFSLRGQIVPVTDLNLRFGHSARPYSLTDQVVVLEQDQLLMGLIVSEVREVIELASETIQPAPKFNVKTHHNASLVTGEVRVGDDIVALLNASQLMHLSQDRWETDTAHPASHFCPQVTPDEHIVFHARAKVLMEATDGEEGVRLALVVVELGGEYFGIELEAVQEFCEIAQPSQIPCCPPHILGAISLRGNLFILLDLRAALNLPHATPVGGKVVIARASTWPSAGFGEQMMGVAVDDIHDVIYLREEELQAPPSALREQHGTEIKGTAFYNGKMMAVMDMPVLLAREEWVVNESV